jgi:hypothetical protein
MILAAAIDDIGSLDQDAVIFARRPWSAFSEARVGPLDGDLRVPGEVRQDGFEYFLEVNLAREVLEAFGTRSPSREDKLRLVIYYAENDAYPDWLTG